MKKAMVLGVLVFVFSAAGAFADHPQGWGIGGVWSSWKDWESNRDYDKFHQDFGLSLKAPSVPLFWGIYLNLDSYGNHSSYFGLNITGDYYIIDQPLVKDIFLNWYLGAGGRLGFGSYSYDPPGAAFDKSWTSLFLGARAVLGLSWQLPINKNALEVFFDVAPSLGVDLYMGDNPPDSHFPAGGWGWDFGVRFWL